jgi:uncharacterized membrane protein YfhO
LSNINLESKSLDYTITCDEGIQFSEGNLKVTNTNAKIKIAFEGLQNTETYLNIQNIWFSGIKPSALYSPEEWDRLNVYNKKVVDIRDTQWNEPVSLYIYASSGNISKVQELETPKFNWYYDKHNFVFNMGYSEEAKDLITLSFNQPGEYTFDSLNVICLPLNNMHEKVKALKENVLENVVTSNNLITGNIKLDKTKILCLAIPYNGGWTAYVNGKPAELLRVNTIYSGLLLEPGDYTIELKYFTPGLKTGLICSLIGVILFAGTIIFRLYRRKKA